MSRATSNKELVAPRFQQRLLNHLQALMTSLGQLSRSYGATLLTFAVIGIALALPMGLSVLIKNIQTVSGGIHKSGQISLYMQTGLPNTQTQQVLSVVKRDKDVASASYISPTQGLNEFSQQSGFGDVLKDLTYNPIPAVIVVQPSQSLAQEWQVRQLYARLQKLPGVANAQFDLQWLQRLQAILAIGHRTTVLLGLLFGFAVLLIIGNTIRLTTQNHRQEILVIKLIGGTNHFIRRPFLYSGAIYGFVGAIFAWLIVDFSLWFLQRPIADLASLYGSNFRLVGFGITPTLTLLLSGALLGLLGAWLSVSRFIANVEPS